LVKWGYFNISYLWEAAVALGFFGHFNNCDMLDSVIGLL